MKCKHCRNEVHLSDDQLIESDDISTLYCNSSFNKFDSSDGESQRHNAMKQKSNGTNKKSYYKQNDYVEQECYDKTMLSLDEQNVTSSIERKANKSSSSQTTTRNDMTYIKNGKNIDAHSKKSKHNKIVGRYTSTPRDKFRTYFELNSDSFCTQPLSPNLKNRKVKTTATQTTYRASKANTSKSSNKNVYYLYVNSAAYIKSSNNSLIKRRLHCDSKASISKNDKPFWRTVITQVAKLNENAENGLFKLRYKYNNTYINSAACIGHLVTEVENQNGMPMRKSEMKTTKSNYIDRYAATKFNSSSSCGTNASEISGSSGESINQPNRLHHFANFDRTRHINDSNYLSCSSSSFDHVSKNLNSYASCSGSLASSSDWSHSIRNVGSDEISTFSLTSKRKSCTDQYNNPSDTIVYEEVSQLENIMPLADEGYYLDDQTSDSISTTECQKQDFRLSTKQVKHQIRSKY